MEGVLPLTDKSKRQLQAVATLLSRRRDEIAGNWIVAYLSSPARETKVTDEQAQLMIRRLVNLFLDNIKKGAFENYYRGLADLGHEYALLGISYTNLVLAVHLYEEVIDPFVADEYLDHQEFLDVILDLDHFNHNTLAVLASSFFGVLVNQLEERAEELVEANRRREEFTSMVAHEFRGPLTVIIGQGQLFGRAQSASKSDGQKVADTIVSQAQRLARLVDDLQDVSQIESGRFRITRERFDFAQLARDIIETQQATTENHQLILRAPSHPIEVSWDRDRVAQGLVNIVGNAIKYSPGGGKITLDVQERNGNVQIAVSDQGEGIAKEDFPQLFRPYSRLYRRQKVKGTGLGLFITLGIVQAHGGDVWVESELGKGTTFHLTIPTEEP